MRNQEWGITEPQGRLLHSFILRERPQQILELGCGIGTSACYMAAALASLGGGTVLSIDRNPNLPTEVDRTFGKVDPAWRRHHSLVVTASSYNDELLRIIDRQTKDGICSPCFDFCFIDGAHTWEADGFAFFLVEKLLRPGAWVLFDDMTWTIAGSASMQAFPQTAAIPREMQEMAQVDRVFRLLVSQHPNFTDLAVTDDWGWARKRRTGEAQTSQSVNAIVELYSKPSILVRIVRRLHRLRHLLPKTK